MRRFLVASILMLFVVTVNAQQKINWMPFGDAAFEKAEAEGKPIHLYLQANWCHWCHVMEDSTYHNIDVIEYLNENFVCVKADQDARPDLANKYRDYGWPALIFYTNDGKEMVKRAGYISPTYFQKLLKAIIKDPSPEIEYAQAKVQKNMEGASLRQSIQERLISSLDLEVGGYDQAQKYVAFDTFEYCLENATDLTYKKWLNKSIEGSFGLNDPVWGGVYQYSTHYDWEHLHFEKLLTIQARYIKMYTMFDAAFGDEKSIKKAKHIAEYVQRFLTPAAGGFYNSQDADIIAGVHSESYFDKSDNERLKEGIPRIDSNVFTSNSARYAEALIFLWATTGDEKYLDKGEETLRLLGERVTEKGSVPHQTSFELLYAEDFLYLTEALLTLRKVNSAAWIEEYILSMLNFGVEKFENQEGLFNSFIGENGLSPLPLVDENIHVARIYNQAGLLFGDARFTKTASAIYATLGTEKYYSKVRNEPSYLLLGEELSKTYYEASIVLKKGENLDELKRKLIALGKSNIQINTYELDNLPKEKEELFGGLGFSALFFCTDSYCSSPISNIDELEEFLDRN